jgi:flagellar protein FlgJ
MKIGPSPTTVLRNVQTELGTAKAGDPFDTSSPLTGKGGPKDEKAQIKALSSEFESLFLGLVLKAMRDTVPKNDIVDGGNAEDIYKSMLDTEYTKVMAAQRNTGIGDNIEKFLLQASGNDEGAKLAAKDFAAKLQETKGLKAYKDGALPPSQLPDPKIQETMINGPSARAVPPSPAKARQPQ